MDASLSTLANCEKLSLSTNCIEKIANLNGLKNLRILSLGRNNIKNLNGLEAVGDTLEELWISYNFIEKLKGIHVMKKLKILYMSNNLVKDWAEFVKLTDLPCLEDLVFVGNPLEEKHSAEGNWIEEATKRVPKLKKLDGDSWQGTWKDSVPPSMTPVSLLGSEHCMRRDCFLMSLWLLKIISSRPIKHFWPPRVITSELCLLQT